MRSYNSITYDHSNIWNLINSKITEEKISIPPTKESLSKLFDSLDLDVSKIK